MGKSKKEDSKVTRRLKCLDITEQKKKHEHVQKKKEFQIKYLEVFGIAVLSVGMMKIIEVI